MTDADHPYVSRGGLKLAAALDAASLNPTGFTCADLGCSVGGFTDCLLQRGAAKIFAVDTAYGQLAWTLRQDPRVVVLERRNALHLDPTTIEGFAPCDLVVFDLGWTVQRLAIPAALGWLRHDEHSRIVTLIKPHYEVSHEHSPKRGKAAPVLSDDEAEAVTARVLSELPELGVRVLCSLPSPIRGGGKRGIEGNREFLAVLARA